MAREFSVLEDVEGQEGLFNHVFVGFNQDFSEGQLHTIDQIALVKDEDELLIFAVDNVEALTALRSYLIEYHPKAIMFGYFRKPKLKGYES